MKKPHIHNWLMIGSMWMFSAIGLGSLYAAEPIPPLALSGNEEVPAVSTTAAATCTIEVDADLGVIGEVETTGIEGKNAFIQLAPRGMNGPVVIALEKVGEYRWQVPAGIHLTPEQYASYKTGGLYVNVTSAEQVSGELRVQLQPIG